MKNSKSILSATGILATILTVGAPVAFAQTPDHSTGTEPGRPAPPVAAAGSESPVSKLTAMIQPVAEGAKVTGNLTFTQAGDVISVSGRIDGLTPIKTYQLVINPPINVTNPQAGAPDNGPSSAGKPSAGPPSAPRPAAGKPNAGKPDGISPPGAPGSGSSGTGVSGTRSALDTHLGNTTPGVSEIAGDLGTVTADSTGGTNVNTTIRNADLGEGPNGIKGRTILISLTSQDGNPSERILVATGVIGNPKGETQIPTEKTTSTR